MSQSTIFQSCRDGATASWVINQYFRGVKCLAQGHNTAAVGFEPPTSRSGVRHSTTEPPRSPKLIFVYETLNEVSNSPKCVKELVQCSILLTTVEVKHFLTVSHHTADSGPTLSAVATALKQTFNFSKNSNKKFSQSSTKCFMALIFMFLPTHWEVSVNKEFIWIHLTTSKYIFLILN